MRKLARDNKVATQMGNQGTANNSLREAVEIIQSGAVGKVSECHVWTNRPIWPQGLERPTRQDPVPDSLDWESWIGPAPMRPYVRGVYNPFSWRGWYDFGCGALGDMACHTMNMPFWALELGYPSTFERVEADTLHKETFPNWSTLRYEFPARKGKAGNDLPACTLFWYDGSRMEDVKGADGSIVRKKMRNYPPKDKFPDGKVPDTGALIIGDKGVMVSGGDYADWWKLLPEADFKGYQKPKPFIPRAHPGNETGHVREFTDAVKGIADHPPMSNFEYAGFLTEVVIAGCLAMHTDKKVEWDGPNMKATNAPELAPLIDMAYRPGWELPGR
jgi:predicted dehydrogenase